jgi:hypothetical protein
MSCCLIYIRASEYPQTFTLKKATAMLAKTLETFNILCGLLPKAEVIH